LGLALRIHGGILKNIEAVDFSKTNHLGGQLITTVTGRCPLSAAFLLKVTEFWLILVVLKGGLPLLVY